MIGTSKTTRAGGRAHPSSRRATIPATLMLMAAMTLGALALGGCDQTYMSDEEAAGLESNIEHVEFGLRAGEADSEAEGSVFLDSPAPTANSGFLIDYTRSERRTIGGNSVTLRHPDPKPWKGRSR